MQQKEQRIVLRLERGKEYILHHLNPAKNRGAVALYCPVGFNCEISEKQPGGSKCRAFRVYSSGEVKNYKGQVVREGGKHSQGQDIVVIKKSYHHTMSSCNST